jgi:hypothetical protein
MNVPRSDEDTSLQLVSPDSQAAKTLPEVAAGLGITLVIIGNLGPNTTIGYRMFVESVVVGVVYYALIKRVVRSYQRDVPQEDGQADVGPNSPNPRPVAVSSRNEAHNED